MYYDGKNYHVFVSELFLGYQMNGWVYQYNEKKGFFARQIYQHENTSWYAFWGKAQNNQPVLYHYDYERGLMRQSVIENGVWQTNTIYNTAPQGAIELYNSQLAHVDYHTQANQFGFEYKVHRDGFYDFLKLKYDWEQSLLKKEKDIAEANERKNPTLLGSLENPVQTRTIRNRQSLANAGCCADCADDAGKACASPVRIVKTQNLKSGKIETENGETVYQTKLGFYDDADVYHEIPERLNCHEDAAGIKQLVLYSDGFNYFIQAQVFERDAEQTVLYQYNETDGWRKESVASAADLVAPSPNGQPINYLAKRQTDQPAQWINAEYENSANRMSRSARLINNILDGAKDEFRYTNPFIPVYCVGDDTSRAIVKPTVFYKEVEGTKIEIPNMPAFKMQDELGDCRAFSLAVILQKYTCDRFAKPNYRLLKSAA